MFSNFFFELTFSSHLVSNNMKIVSVQFLLILLVYQYDSYKIVGVSVSVRFFLKQVSVRVRKSNVSVRSRVATLVYTFQNYIKFSIIYKYFYDI